jgi:cytochrome c-type biogenesis protein CcmH/NrfF
MKQQSAISSRLLATTASTSRNTTTRVRKPWSLLAIATVLILTTAASDTNAARFNDLGHRMMCTCNCKQVLLECNHGGRFSLTGSTCENFDHMRAELKAALEKGDKDDVILQSFVQKYGATVLLEPSTKGPSKLVWMVVFAVLIAIASMGIVFVRKRQSPPAAVTTTPLSELDPIEVDMLRRRVRAQTENDDW